MIAARYRSATSYNVVARIAEELDVPLEHYLDGSGGQPI